MKASPGRSNPAHLNIHSEFTLIQEEVLSSHENAASQSKAQIKKQRMKMSILLHSEFQTDIRATCCVGKVIQSMSLFIPSDTKHAVKVS